ncbi:MAG: 50S ribosomal protein L10 [Desulfovibrionales bacterium]|nr:50S ribosomal protein L10 [Desulfovibrionales bacterium]
MNKAEKAKIIESLKEKADKASIAIVTDFQGLKVSDLTPLRSKLHASGCDYQVVKNTLARKAFEEGPHEVLGSHLKYNCAVAFGYDDPVVAAKVLVEFAKKTDKFSVRYASLDGTFLEEASIKALSELPGREQLLGSLLGTMNAVPQNFVSLFANVIRGLVNVLTALKDKQEE